MKTNIETKRYIELENPSRNATHLKIEVYYSLGGYNLFTYKPEERGYYLSVSPVCKFNRNGVTMESYTAFSGIKKCIKPVSRQSKKAAAQAGEIAKNHIHELVTYVCNTNGLNVPTEFINPEEN